MVQFIRDIVPVFIINKPFAEPLAPRGFSTLSNAALIIAFFS
jgi:hypothetical protein